MTKIRTKNLFKPIKKKKFSGMKQEQVKREQQTLVNIYVYKKHQIYKFL